MFSVWFISTRSDFRVSTKNCFDCEAKLLIPSTFSVKIRISAETYRFSNSRPRCEEIIHGTRIGVTLGEDLQVDAGEGGAVEWGTPLCLRTFFWSLCSFSTFLSFFRTRNLFFGTQRRQTSGLSCLMRVLLDPIYIHVQSLHCYTWMKRHRLILDINVYECS